MPCEKGFLHVTINPQIEPITFGFMSTTLGMMPFVLSSNFIRTCTCTCICIHSHLHLHLHLCFVKWCYIFRHSDACMLLYSPRFCADKFICTLSAPQLLSPHYSSFAQSHMIPTLPSFRSHNPCNTPKHPASRCCYSLATQSNPAIVPCTFPPSPCCSLLGPSLGTFPLFGLCSVCAWVSRGKVYAQEAVHKPGKMERMNMSVFGTIFFILAGELDFFFFFVLYPGKKNTPMAIPVRSSKPETFTILWHFWPLVVAEEGGAGEL